MENVINFDPSGWQYDIEEYCREYKTGQPHSDRKNHFGYALCKIIENDTVPMNLRRQAGYVLYEYSDYRVALDSIFLERQNPTEIRTNK